MRHGKYWTQRMDRFQDEKNPELRPRRERRNESKDQRTKDRMKALQVGFIQSRRSLRWVIRSHGDPLMYAIWEHIFDLAKFKGPYRGRALIYFWEIADDLNINCATVARKVRRLEELGFIWVRRAKSDVFPNMFGIIGYNVKQNSTGDISSCGQNEVTPCTTRSQDEIRPGAGQRSERI